MRDSMVFYRSFWESLRELEPEDLSQVFNAVMEYALDDVEPEIKGVGKAIFSLMRPQIDANNRKYENGKKGAEGGKMGGRPKKEGESENPRETPKEPQRNP